MNKLRTINKSKYILQNIQRYTFLDQKLFNQDHYKILGVQPNATKDEIKKQYYKLTKLYHPDINKGNEEKFKQINSAWDVLSNDTKRKEYDSYNNFFGSSNSNSGFNNASNGFNNSSSNGFNNNNSGFNPFGGFNGGQFGQNPFHPSGQGQNPFGQGSPFGNIDLDQLLKELKQNGIKLEDIQNNPHFGDFNKAFGLNNEQPKNFTDKVKNKVKQEAVKLMLRKMQEKLEKEILYHKEQKEKYQQQSQSNTYSNNNTYSSQQSNYNNSNQQNNQYEFDPFKGFKRPNQQSQQQQSTNSNKQTYYTNKPTGNSKPNNTINDTINKASDMFSSFFKKK